MNNRRVTVITACLFASLAMFHDVRAQHGIIREYAALAPKPDAVPLVPLRDAPLTDASMTLGPEKAFYLTGTAVEGGTATFSSPITIWRSLDMKQWAKVRTLDFGVAQLRSPEIHFLDGGFWLTLGRKGGGTELLKFETAELGASMSAHRTRRAAEPTRRKASPAWVPCWARRWGSGVADLSLLQSLCGSAQLRVRRRTETVRPL